MPPMGCPTLVGLQLQMATLFPGKYCYVERSFAYDVQG